MRATSICHAWCYLLCLAIQLLVADTIYNPLLSYIRIRNPPEKLPNRNMQWNTWHSQTPGSVPDSLLQKLKTKERLNFFPHCLNSWNFTAACIYEIYAQVAKVLLFFIAKKSQIALCSHKTPKWWQEEHKKTLFRIRRYSAVPWISQRWLSLNLTLKQVCSVYVHRGLLQPVPSTYWPIPSDR